MKAWIAGTGSYVPIRVMTNAEICARAPTTDEWIQNKLGIVERRVAADDEQTSDLATNAANRALEMARLAPADIDGILMATGTGDVLSPSTAGIVQQKLGVTNRCFAFDMRMACAGPVGALMMARGMIESGLAKRLLVIGTTLSSRSLTDYADRTMAPLMGDGAGACVVVGADGDRGILESRLYTDGALAGIIGQPGGGTQEPLTAETLAAGRHLLRMDGKAVWECASRELPAVVREVLAARKLSVSDVDFVVSHQPNRILLEKILGDLGVPLAKAEINVDRYGNTASASALIALDEAVRGERLRRGQLLMLMAIGAGMTWGAHLIRW